MAEELNNVQEQSEAKALIALTQNRGKNKILVTSMEGYESGYTVDGIYVTDGKNAVIVGLTEGSYPYGGSSTDLTPEDPLYDAGGSTMYAQFIDINKIKK